MSPTGAFSYLDFHLRLSICGGGEDLALLGGDGGVAIDQLRKDAAQRLDAQGKRRHVQQENVGDIAGENAALNRGAHRHGFVRVDGLGRSAAEDVLDDRLHLGHSMEERDTIIPYM